MRIDRCLANSGFGSRTEVKELIRLGLVTLDGVIVHDPGLPVPDSLRQRISVAGTPARIRHYVHLMLHKPAGLITALDDPRQRTIAELIPANWLHTGVFPVGRLDIDTTGLLILTNDGTLGHRLANPRWEVWKTYALTTTGRPFEAADVTLLAQGLQLADGLVCQPARLEISDAHNARLTIHEGKFHQVKRMMLATGRTVTSLQRLSIGPVELDETLAPGQWRELTDTEIAGLYRIVDLEPADPLDLA